VSAPSGFEGHLKDESRYWTRAEDRHRARRCDLRNRLLPRAQVSSLCRVYGSTRIRKGGLAWLAIYEVKGVLGESRERTEKSEGEENIGPHERRPSKLQGVHNGF
jgi:hypothetical protein